MEVVPLLLGLLTGIVILYILYVLIMYIFFNEFAALTDLQQASNNPVTIDKDRLASGSNTGNYTYSVWVYVLDWNYGFGEKKSILKREMANGNGSPALEIYMGPNTNDIIIETQCYGADGPNGQRAKCQVDNFPLQTWVNLTVSQYGRTCDVYIDGKLVRTCVLPGTALAGTGNVVLTSGIGFHGYTCKLRYFDNATNPQQAYNIYKDGPCAIGTMTGYRLVFEILQGDESKYKLTI